MGKYATLALAETKKHLADRARFVIWILVDTLGVLIFPFLWLAIFGEREIVHGFTRADIVTYFVLVYIFALVVSSHSALYIHDSIMQGNLNKLLVKPISALLYHHVAEYGYKLLSAGFGLVLFAILLWLFPSYVHLPASAGNFLWFLFFLVIARLHSFAIQAIIGFSSFWMGETGALMQLRYILEKIFSGEFGPLTLFPLLLQQIGAWLPFQYLFFVPIQIYLGKLSAQEILAAAGGALLWSAAYMLIIGIMWKRGVKTYEGVGV